MLTSKELYDKIEIIRRQKGLSVSKLTFLAGISHSTLYAWKIRGTMPKLEVLEGLSSALEIPLAALLHDVDQDKLTGEQIDVLFLWGKLSDDEKKVIMAMMQLILRQ